MDEVEEIESVITTVDAVVPPVAPPPDVEKVDNQAPPPPIQRDRAKTYVATIGGNRDTTKGWPLKAVPSTLPSGEVEITEYEWRSGTEFWETTLVGYALGKRLSFRKVSSYVKS